MTNFTFSKGSNEDKFETVNNYYKKILKNKIKTILFVPSGILE
jgi:hypothetical protein